VWVIKEFVSEKLFLVKCGKNCWYTTWKIFLLTHKREQANSVATRTFMLIYLLQQFPEITGTRENKIPLLFEFLSWGIGHFSCKIYLQTACRW
jgi:hypothetical protein